MIDADVIIRGEKGTFDLKAWLQSVENEQFEIAGVTVAELWHGVERADESHRKVRENYLRSLLSVIPVIPYTEQTAYHHARIWAQLQSSGKIIGPYDLIVAATAVEHESQVATFNKRHFAGVEGLAVIEPK